MLPSTTAITVRRCDGYAVGGEVITSTKKGRAGTCRVTRLYVRRLRPLGTPRTAPI